MLHDKRGFTLIELLVVIAIIGVLAAILFPVISTARGKARQAKCVSNQKQVAQTIQIWTQDHDERFPTEEIWQELPALPPGALQCPDRPSLQNPFVYNSYLAGRSLNIVKSGIKELLIADGQHDLSMSRNANLAYGPDDIAFRHGQYTVATFVDGHVIVTANYMDLSVEFRPAPALDVVDLDTQTMGSWWVQPDRFTYGKKGYVLCGWSGDDVKELTDSYVQDVIATGNDIEVWEATSSDARALANPATGGRSAACWQNDATYTIKVADDDNDLHTMRIYCVDFDEKNRTMELMGLDSGDKPLMKAPYRVTDFSGGTWVTILFRGTVKLQVKSAAGPNAVISGFMFD